MPKRKEAYGNWYKGTPPDSNPRVITPGMGQGYRTDILGSPEPYPDPFGTDLFDRVEAPTAGELFLANLLQAPGNNGATFSQNMLASNPLDNPLDPQYEKMKSIMDAQGPIDPLERVYESPEHLDPLTGLPGFDQVSVPYQVPDPWLVADANVPINVNQGSDQHGGGATIANPTTLENSGGSPEYQRRFRESMTGGDPTRGGGYFQ